MIRVAIIEDQREIREGLRELIDGAGDFCCSGAFGSIEETLPKIGSDLPDVVLVDIGLPGKSGIEGIRLLKERYPELELVVLSVFDDDRRVFEAICAGACGYLLKRTSAPRLIQGIRDAAAGGSPMSPEIAARNRHFPAGSPGAPRGSRFDASRSPRVEAAGGWSQLQNRRGGIESQRQHHLIPCGVFTRSSTCIRSRKR